MKLSTTAFREATQLRLQRFKKRRFADYNPTQNSQTKPRTRLTAELSYGIRNHAAELHLYLDLEGLMETAETPAATNKTGGVRR